MDKKLTLCLGVHNHQPVGNFGFVFEEACEKCYEPFFETIGKYPGVRIQCAYSWYI